MEKTSLKLVFLFSLTVIAYCSYLGNATEMQKEEVNCLGGKCPEGKKNCNCSRPGVHIMETNATCYQDSDCIKYCPEGCKSGTCVCACNYGCVCEC